MADFRLTDPIQSGIMEEEFENRCHRWLEAQRKFLDEELSLRLPKTTRKCTLCNISLQLLYNVYKKSKTRILAHEIT